MAIVRSLIGALKKSYRTPCGWLSDVIDKATAGSLIAETTHSNDKPDIRGRKTGRKPSKANDVEASGSSSIPFSLRPAS